MRFERLHLEAFGPFTDEVLDLSGGAPGGLHVVYGANEAGKSTSLRAVTALLFGFPHRTQDAHLHPQNRLSVTGELSDGARRVVLTRKKRRKDDLLNQAGEPFDENPLPALLSNVDERSFTSRFGLDQVELERGAEALLGGSEHGVFAAGTAGARVREVLDALARETSELYLARGKVPLLNRALLDYENKSRDARRAERPPEKYLEQQRAFEGARSRVAELRKERSETRAEQRRLQRLRSVLKDLKDWDDVEKRRVELGSPPPLPEDATEIRTQAERQLQEAAAEARRIEAEILAFEKESAALPPDSPLAEVDDEQLHLATRLGKAISAREDMPKRQASLLEQIRQIRELFRELDHEIPVGSELEFARNKLVTTRASTSVRHLAAERSGLVQALHGARAELERIARQRAELGEASGAPEEEATGLGPERGESSLDDLEAALADARAHLAALERTRELEGQRGAIQAEITAISARLPRLRARSLDELCELLSQAPTREGARALGAEHRRLVEQLVRAREEHGQAQEQLEKLNARISRARDSDLPSGEQLVRARAQRDEAALEIFRASDTQAPTPPRAARHLADWIKKSDDVADRLRAEAERVAAVAALDERRAELEERCERTKTSLASATAARDAHLVEFQEKAKILGVEGAASPQEAEELFESLRVLVQRRQDLVRLEGTLAEMESQTSRVQERLRALVGVAQGDGLAGLVVRAARAQGERVVREARRVEKREALSRLRTAEREAAQLVLASEKALSVWEARWHSAMATLGLSSETTPNEAEETLATFEKVARILDVAVNLEGRIAGMQRDTNALAHDVRQVLRRHLPTLLDVDPVDAAVELQEAIRSAKRVAEERARHRRMILERRASLSSAVARKTSAEGRLADLMKLAGVDHIQELPAAEERKREIRSLALESAKLEKAIRDAAEGATLEQLWAEASEWQSRGQLTSQLDELEARAQELEEDLREAEKNEASLKLGLSTYMNADVVEARQRASQASAEAGELLRRYLVVESARRMLESQVTSYAERFAGPIVGRASELFQRLTLGRYQALKVGLGEKTLRMVRDGTEIEASELSRGTRAQLYFALRLASLEHYFEKQPAIPLVFDDLFVDFDDDRTTAAFEVLAELSEKVQILYFTHLARDVESAHDAVPRGLLFEHRLSGG